MLTSPYWRSDEVFTTGETPLASAEGRPIETVTPERLAELCGSREHQGWAARMSPYPYLTLATLLERCSDRPRLLVLDRIQYANNFGTMLRTAEVLGLDGCLVTDRGQCEMTAAIGRLSAGAAFHVPVAREEDLAAAIATLRAAGLSCFSTDAATGDDCRRVDFAAPVAVVIGHEHEGVAPAITAACSATLTIPQRGRTQSLNAAASAAILMHEMTRNVTRET